MEENVMNNVTEVVEENFNDVCSATVEAVSKKTFGWKKLAAVGAGVTIAAAIKVVDKTTDLLDKVRIKKLEKKGYTVAKLVADDAHEECEVVEDDE
jgi:hypothetical protein